MQSYDHGFGNTRRTICHAATGHLNQPLNMPTPLSQQAQKRGLIERPAGTKAPYTWQHCGNTFVAIRLHYAQNRSLSFH
jgi:hypothetical protein